jgi:hypothetical protein
MCTNNYLKQINEACDSCCIIQVFFHHIIWLCKSLLTRIEWVTTIRQAGKTLFDLMWSLNVGQRFVLMLKVSSLVFFFSIYLLILCTYKKIYLIFIQWNSHLFTSMIFVRFIIVFQFSLDFSKAYWWDEFLYFHFLFLLFSIKSKY